MAKHILKDMSLRSVKPESKDKRLKDGDGLYLLVKPNGSKWWRFDYTIEGKRDSWAIRSAVSSHSSVSLVAAPP